MALNLRKRMNKNSQIIVTIPNGYGPWELKNRIFVYPITHNNIIRKLLNKPIYVKGGSEHCQFFTKDKIIKLFSTLGFKKLAFGKSDSILATLPYDHEKIESMDTKIADLLPSVLASGWYFVFELTK